MRFTLTCFAAILSIGFYAASAVAETGFQRITSETEFIEKVGGKDLKIFGISVRVLPEGEIDGRAYGRNVKGAWQWNDGFFCRDLFWGKRDMGPNCQEVKVDGNIVRFTSDKGAGIYADLKIH